MSERTFVRHTRRYTRGVTRRDEILSTAGEMFQRRGYHATSIRDIAERLNLRGSSLYSHIASKEELLWEIVQRAADHFDDAAAEASAGDPPPAERLAALVRGHLAVIARELPTAAVFLHEWRFLPAARRREVVARRDAYERHFRRAIDDGVADGSFRCEDPRLAALFVLSALNWSHEWLRPDGPLDPEALAERYNALVFGALGHPAAPPAPPPAPAADREPAREAPEP